MHPFVSAVRRHGEAFGREVGSGRVTASVRNSTRATYSLANRACFFEGLSEAGPYVGEYLTRAMDGKRYLVETVQPEPQCTALEILYLAQCNQRVTLARPRDALGEHGDAEPEYVVLAEDVPVFMDTTTRSMKAQNDGLLDQAIYIVHLPARYGIQKMDRLYLRRGGVPLGESQRYRVESINDSLTPIDEKVDASGIDVLQLVDDLRVGNVKLNSGGEPAP